MMMNVFQNFSFTEPLFLAIKKKKKRKMSAIQWKSESELHFHLKGPFVTQLRAFFFFC